MKKVSILYAIVAAVCYAISVPAAKILLQHLSPILMASLLYLGAGIGMLVVNLFQNKRAREKEARITRRELPWVAAIVALDIAAPIFLMVGLSMTTSATAALLGNFELVITAAVALVFFKEAIGRRMWVAVGLITSSSIILSVEDFSSFKFSAGAIFVLLSCVCWGVDNSCTRTISFKDPTQISVIKGLGAGIGALAVAVITGNLSGQMIYVAIALVVGFVGYGLSTYLYVLAQRGMGATRTSVFFSASPFIGAGLSLVLFWEKPALSFLVASAVMAAGTTFAAFERHSHEHTHLEREHEHRHRHDDGHHDHPHDPPVWGEHSHPHRHAAVTHSHAHTPDLHHTHAHE